MSDIRSLVFTAERKIELTEEHIKLLESFSPQFREREFKTPNTDNLFATDTYFRGTIKAVSNTASTALPHCPLVRFYLSKVPIAAVHSIITAGTAGEQLPTSKLIIAEEAQSQTLPVMGQALQTSNIDENHPFS